MLPRQGAFHRSGGGCKSGARHFIFSDGGLNSSGGGLNSSGGGLNRTGGGLQGVGGRCGSGVGQFRSGARPLHWRGRAGKVADGPRICGVRPRAPGDGLFERSAGELRSKGEALRRGVIAFNTGVAADRQSAGPFFFGGGRSRFRVNRDLAEVDPVVSGVQRASREKGFRTGKLGR